jgi:leucyl aminopeptidase (aminopeptidase T)
MNFAPTRVRSADHLLQSCGGLRTGERIVVICDGETRGLGELFLERARLVTSKARLVESPVAQAHGQEPSAEAAAAMLDADLIVGITSRSMAHTRARLEAAKAGARYMSLPDYSETLMCDPCLMVDYRAAYADVRFVADAFDRGASLRVTSAAGTDIVADIRGRKANACPGFVAAPGELGSPPDIEANISPLETKTQGVAVIDGSIAFPGFGLIDRPIALRLDGGSIVDIIGDRSVAGALWGLFGRYGDKSRILAECGVGLNREAKLTGSMLTDEGAYGTVHFGFGSNATVGGVNDVPFHIDLVLRQPTIAVDGREIMRSGELTR